MPHTGDDQGAESHQDVLEDIVEFKRNDPKGLKTSEKQHLFKNRVQESRMVTDVTDMRALGDLNRINAELTTGQGMREETNIHVNGQSFKIEGIFGQEQKLVNLSQLAGTQNPKPIDSDDENDLKNDDDKMDNDLAELMMEDYKAGSANHEDNKVKFINQYGISLEVPGVYIYDSKINPKNKSQIIQVVRYFVPKDSNDFTYKVLTHHMNDNPKESKKHASIGQIYNDKIYSEAIVLRLIAIEGNKLLILKQIVLPLARTPKIVFSPNGQYFCILLKRLGKLHAYSIEHGDMMQLMDSIEDGTARKQVEIDKLYNFENISWDGNSQFITISSKLKVSIVDMREDRDTYGTVLTTIQMDDIKFDQIVDVEVRHHEQRLQGFECLMACLVKGQRNIRIFNPFIDHDDEEKDRSISFALDSLQNCQIKFSRDFTQVAFANKEENYILNLERDIKDDIFYMRSLPQLEGKIIKKIIQAGEAEFIFVCCYDYDDQIDILSSKNEQFKLEIMRQVEPGFMKVHDIVQDNENTDGVFGDTLTMLSVMDDHFYCDEVQPAEHYHKLLANNFVESMIASSNKMFEIDEIQGFDFTWPYITFKGLFHNYQYIFNANHRSIIHRVELPHDLVAVKESYISELLDLFMLVETELEFVLLKCDLDKFEDNEHKFKNQIFKVVELMRYSKVDVGGFQIDALHVRSSSEKEPIDMNKKIIAFMLHGGDMFYWVEGKGKIKKVNTNFSIVSESFTWLNDNNIILFTEHTNDQNERVFALRQIIVEFSGFEIKILYQQRQILSKVKAFAYDMCANILVLIKKFGKKATGHHKLQIMDIGTNEILYESKTDNAELFGRLKTQNLIFLNGHIYYGNKCIKIRYDLLRDKKTIRDLKEYEVFDYYDNILCLKKGETIMIGQPSFTPEANRMMYIVKGKKNESCRKLLFTPYLHERKIMLNKTREDNEYFFTTFDRTESDSKTIISCLLSMNITDSKYYIYSLKGMLRERVNFKALTATYGKARAVSNNGLIFIFKKPSSFELNILLMTNSEGLAFVKTVNIQKRVLEMIENDSLPGIEDLRSAINSGDFQSIKLEPSNNMLSFVINDSMDLMVQIQPATDDLMQAKKLGRKKNKLYGGGKQWDVLKYKDLRKRMKNVKDALFYFERGNSNISSEDIQAIYQKSLNKMSAVMSKGRNKSYFFSNYNELQQKFLFITSSHAEFEKGVRGFNMTRDHAYFYNEQNVWRFDLKTEEHKFSMLGLHVDEENKQSKIQQVRTGSVDSHIIIMVKQSMRSKFSILWDVEKDNEIESFDHGLNPLVLWDEMGDAYITENNLVFFCEQGTSMRCYDVEEMNSRQLQTNKLLKSDAFGYHRGHKFDYKDHSWMFLREFITLSFSYMTFVINSKMQQFFNFRDDEYLFDPEQYNFIISKSTYLHDAQLIANPEKLTYVLKNFETTDRNLLNQLQYQQIKYVEEKNDQNETVLVEKVETPLHIAVKQNNNKSINILLKYMAKMDYCNMSTFKDIWNLIVDYQSFTNFIWGLCFQTIQMQNKQNLKVANQWSDKFVSINATYTMFVDEHFFREHIHEQEQNQNFNSYPVKMQAFEIGWIINTEEGFDFLQALQSTENMDLFESDPIQILIEYLFSKFKLYTLKRRLPIYAFALIVYLFTIYEFEHYASMNDQLKLQDAVTVELTMDQIENRMTAIVIINAIVAGIAVLNIFAQSIFVRETYWLSYWAYFDLVHSCLSVVIAILISLERSYPTEYMKAYRVVMSVMAIMVWAKGFYFIELIDKVSPLIHSIFMIFFDIKWFMITFIISIIGFAMAFLLLGYNQIQFDEIEPSDDYSGPSYITIWGSLEYTYLLALGEVSDAGNYGSGNGTQFLVLWLLFILATLDLLVNMLNMLIAIMGNTFEENQTRATLTIYKNKLKFVCDNWWMKAALGEDKQKIQYIVASIFNEEDDEDVEIIKEVQKEVAVAQKERKEMFTNVLKELKKVKQKLAAIEKQKQE